MSDLIASSRKCLDRFLFESCEPLVASIIRIAYGSLLIVLVSVWILDANHWFTEAGVLRADTAYRLSLIPHWSIFFISSSPWIVKAGLGILFIQSLLLLLGIWSRWQAACIFVWLTSFQHRNPLICDGEDTVFRLMAFFMIFLPLDEAWSVIAYRRRFKIEKGDQAANRTSRAWGLRLIQIEMTAIYLSAGWSKLQGATWRDGSAMYYVLLMDDYGGRSWVAESILEIPMLIRLATWLSLAIECLLPFGLWFGPTRRLALLIGIGFHLAIESTMNLFLFEWIMMVGLLSFLSMDDLRVNRVDSTRWFYSDVRRASINKSKCSSSVAAEFPAKN